MKKHKILKDFKHLTDNNVGHAVHYTYDTDYDCQNGSNCCDNDYCRCGTIINTDVPVDVNNSYNIAAMLVRKQGLIKDFRFYCLERLISCMLRENTECFEVRIGGGYYGEEAKGVSLNWNVANVINNFIEQLNKHKTKAHYRDLVEQVLSLEYGYVLSSVVNKDWTYERVSIKNIRLGNEKYNNTNANTISQYAKQYSKVNLSCLCKKNNEKEFILVDGYHRFAAANKRNDKSMMVMWCAA